MNHKPSWSITTKHTQDNPTCLRSRHRQAFLALGLIFNNIFCSKMAMARSPRYCKFLVSIILDKTNKKKEKSL